MQALHGEVYGQMTSANLDALRYNLIREMVMLVYEPLHGDESARDAILQRIAKIKDRATAGKKPQHKISAPTIARKSVASPRKSSPKAIKPIKYAEPRMDLPHDTGDLWCGKCQSWKKPKEFTKDRTKLTGHRFCCKPCEPRYQGRTEPIRARNQPVTSQDGCRPDEHRCVCGLVAHKTLFYVNKSCKDGYGFTCLECRKVQDRALHARQRGARNG